ncbi:MAG TPA: ATP-dependent helicase, partial [Acidimicrobiales bacterium]|nr:ATP-dependent helicase [Acidimicrobiales bacterium]
RLGLDPAFTVMDQGDTAELLGLVRHDLLSGGGPLGPSGPLGDAGRLGNPERLGDPVRIEDANRFGHADRFGDADRLAEARAPAHPAGAGRRFPRAETLAAIYSRTVNTQQRLATVLSRDFPWCHDSAEGIRGIFEAYTVRKREQRLLDYDDLLVCWRALAAAPGGGDLLAGLWDHVLVDEYQDTNALQADILAALSPDGAGVTVVGDDAQAIYAFRAASSRNILDFPTRFPATTVIRLEHNYRSTTPILAVANAVMASAGPGARYAKTLWSSRQGRRRPILRTCEDEATQAEVVCDSVLAHREEGVLLQQQAVLFRASHHADVLELALTRRNIPYVKYGGLKFLEAAHVKDLLALLKVLDNPWDELAWFRVLRLLEGVGQGTARRVMADLGVRDGRSASRAPSELPGGLGWAPGSDPAVTPLARLLAAAPRVPVAAEEELAGLRSALADCADTCLPGGATPPPGVQVERLRQWLGPLAERRYDSASARMADLEQLEHAAGRYPSRGRFVAELTLDPPASTSDLAGPPHLDEDWLVLSTVHSAKGGEWDVVHVLHAADGMFPSDMACGDAEGIEEERRLLYVAVTRARDSLEINVPLRYYHQRHGQSDSHSYGQISRFLTGEVRAEMDIEHVGAPAWTGPDEAVGGSGGLKAVDDFLAGLWGPDRS